jgi:hypothetical protein
VYEGYVGTPQGVPIETKRGSILFPFSYFVGNRRFISGCIRSQNRGTTWDVELGIDIGEEADAARRKHGLGGGGFEPAIVQLRDGRVWMLMRTITNYMWESFSSDEGKTWTSPRRTSITCGGTLFITRLRSNRLVLLWNQADFQKVENEHWANGYARMALSLSEDEGKTWLDPLILAEGPPSGPARVVHSLLLEHGKGELLISMPTEHYLRTTEQTVCRSIGCTEKNRGLRRTTSDRGD